MLEKRRILTTTCLDFVVFSGTKVVDFVSNIRVIKQTSLRTKFINIQEIEKSQLEVNKSFGSTVWYGGTHVACNNMNIFLLPNEPSFDCGGTNCCERKLLANNNVLLLLLEL